LIENAYQEISWPTTLGTTTHKNIKTKNKNKDKDITQKIKIKPKIKIKK
jgi:hypothetical protein